MALLPAFRQSPRLDLADGHMEETGQAMPTPPLMRIVTKGWWNRPDEYATAEDLEKADNERR